MATLDLFVQAMFPDGFDLVIRPRKSGTLSALKQRSKIAAAAAFHRGDRTLRNHMRALGKLGGVKGGKARADALSQRRLSEIGKAGARARWKKPRVVEITAVVAGRAKPARGGRQP
jgi:hypothetical protein